MKPNLDICKKCPHHNFTNLIYKAHDEFWISTHKNRKQHYCNLTLGILRDQWGDENFMCDEARIDSDIFEMIPDGNVIAAKCPYRLEHVVSIP